MIPIRIVLFLSALLLAACASHEGLYEPGCIAFEGHRIKLEGGRFEWQRFTDQRVIGDDGKIVDPFPGFPKTGTYSRSATRVDLRADDGSSLDSWFLVEQGEQVYLLTGPQHDAVTAGKPIPACALVLRGAGS